MELYIIGGILVLLLIVFLVIYNKLIRRKNKVHEAFSTMDVYLKKRWDLIPNLIEVVKGYSDYENKTLKEIVEVRNMAYEQMDDSKKVKVNGRLGKQIMNLIALAEQYPELKANNVYLNLSNELSSVENDIENSRKYYNACVRMLNDSVEMFPSNIVAKMCGFKKGEMFEITNEEKENVSVKLD